MFVSSPRIGRMPPFIQLLGYNPFAEVKTLAEHMVQHQTTLVFSRKAAAVELGVDVTTRARWERVEREPACELLEAFTRWGQLSSRSVQAEGRITIEGSSSGYWGWPKSRSIGSPGLPRRPGPSRTGRAQTSPVNV